jgi:hypothetical protein
VNCQSCGDVGIVRVPWSNAPDDFAVCLCKAGHQMRDETNAGKPTGYALWQVWAYREQIDPSRLFLLEEILTPEELAARGFTVTPAVMSREAALLNAGKRRAKL